MTDFAAWLIYRMASLAARLPWPWLRAAADALAATWMRAGVRESRVALRNLEMAYPEVLPAQRAVMHREVLRSTARQAAETLCLWTRPHRQNLQRIVDTHGTALFDAAIDAGRGVIVLAPHYGNWELLNQWLADRTPLSILYRRPESPIGEAFLRRVRADSAGRVTQVPAEGAGIRQLFRVLKAGGVVGILPDQQPKGGDGVFAPFFGIDALTMTLVGRLAQRSGATVVLGYCERMSPDLQFALHLQDVAGAIADADPVVAASALNDAVEAIARRDPAQYQWTYKRYTLRPPGSGQDNPYRDLEIGR